jgi:hypothetical protein
MKVKRSRWILSLVTMCLLLSTLACGGPKEPVIETPAKEMNFSAADIGSGWSQIADTGLDEMPDFKQAHIQDANMRMFGPEGAIGMVMSIVISTKSVASAQTEMAGDTVKNMGKNLQEQVPGATLSTLEPPEIGDEAVMVGGSHPDTGLNIYLLTFRKANVVAMLSLVAPADFATEEAAVEYGRKLEGNIR